MKGSSAATACSKVELIEPDPTSECALKAFAERRALCFWHYVQDAESFDFMGISVGESGDAYYVDYSSTEIVKRSILPKEWQTSFDHHTSLGRRPEPVRLNKAESARLACYIPLSPHVPTILSY